MKNRNYQARVRQFKSRLCELEQMHAEDKMDSSIFRRVLSKARLLAKQLEQALGKTFVLRIIAGSALLALLVLGKDIQAQTFGAKQTNPFGLNPTILSTYSNIQFADIDGDGDLDLIHMDLDYYNYIVDLILFKNSGTALTPSFDAPQTNPFGFNSFTEDNVDGEFAYFDIADIDGDGDKDILLVLNDAAGTSIYENNVYLFKNSGTATNPNFSNAPLKNPYGLALPDNIYYTVPNFADFDNDGDLDLLIMGYDESSATKFFFLRNNGSVQSPMFGNPQVDPFGLSGFSEALLNLATVGDLDNDSDIDILVHHYYGGYSSYESKFLFLRNNGTAAIPAFVAPVSNPFNLQPEGVSSTNFGISPELADIDNDGDLDVFVLGYDHDDLAIFFQKNDSPSNTGGVNLPEIKADIHLFPNPAAQNLNIFIEFESSANLPLRITISNALGQECYSHLIHLEGNKYSEAIPLNGITPGIYWVNMFAGENNVSKMFLKE